MDLTQTITHREKIKKNVFDQHQTVWEKRASLVDLKRKFPSLGTKEDDELLQDKERAPKRQKNESSAYVLHSLTIGLIADFVAVESLLSSYVPGMILRHIHIRSTWYGRRRNSLRYKVRSRRTCKSKRSGTTTGKTESK